MKPVSKRPLDLCFSPVWLSLSENTRNVREALEGFTSGRLLDIGCGIKPFEKEDPAIEWVGFDVDSNPYADVHGSALDLPFEAGSFDCVLATQVLEHVDDPEKMLKECARVLRPGGMLILSCPQYWELHEEPHDFFRFTEYGLRALCERTGFSIAKVHREGCGIKLAGLALNAAINNAGPRPHSLFSKLLKAPFYFVINALCLIFEPLLRNERDVQNYTVVATRP